MISVDVQFSRREFALSAAFETDRPVTGVFGASGAGKSTLLQLIAGLERPRAGSIRIGDTVLFDAEDRIDQPPRRRRVGYVFQDGWLFPHLSVAGNLRYGMRKRTAASRRLGFDEVVELLELGPLLRRSSQRISGGERQRVALGRALLREPRVLLLDEPLASLDRRRKQVILPFLRRVQERWHLPTLYVSHDLTEVLQLTDRVIVLEAGQVVGHGSIPDLARQTAAWRAMHDSGLRNVMRLGVRSHDRDAGLTRLGLPGKPADGLELMGPLRIDSHDLEVHASIAPADIALALNEIPNISIQNQVPGTVLRVTTHADRTVAEVDIGATLLVEVSHRAVRSMQLGAGRRVVCLIKSNAIEYL